MGLSPSVARLTQKTVQFPNRRELLGRTAECQRRSYPAHGVWQILSARFRLGQAGRAGLTAALQFQVGDDDFGNGPGAEGLIDLFVELPLQFLQARIVEIAAMGLAEQFLNILLDMVLARRQALPGQGIDRLQKGHVQREIGPGRSAALDLVSLKMEVTQTDLRTGRGLGTLPQTVIGEAHTVQQDGHPDDDQ